jgi:hypothetical protein
MLAGKVAGCRGQVMGGHVLPGAPVPGAQQIRGIRQGVYL